MYYYDPNDRGPRRWAVIALTLYASVLAIAFWFVSFDISRIVEKPNDTIEIEFLEPEPPRPTVASVRRVHEHATSEEQVSQVDGADETTRTPNPKALSR